MKLSNISIKRPVSVSMFFIGTAIISLYLFSGIGVDLLPNVYLPHLIVQTNYINASAEEVEKLVTEPLESAAGTVTGVKKISSVSKEGVSVISVDFLWGTDMDMAVLSLREKLDNVGFALPLEADRPTIIRADPSASPIISMALTYNNRQTVPKSQYVSRKKGEEEYGYNLTFVKHDSPEYEIRSLINLREAARVVFKRRLEQIDGVAQAVVTGGLEREILVEVDPVKLDTYDLTFSDLSNVLKASNVKMPAGSIMKGLFRYSLRAIGEYDNTDQIKQTIVKYNKDGSVVYIDDVANVLENFKEREGLSRLNGSETIGLLIYKQPESNTVTISEKVNDVVKILREEYPEYNLLVVTDQAGFINNAITNVKLEVQYGGILAIIVLFFFLGSLRNVFAIGITIPASLVLTVILMSLFNINFNIISLGGLAVGIGMLLDNSIIVIENIVRYKEKGLTLRQAAIQGASEVSMPVVTATLTTIAVFLPLIFIQGIAGELFKDQSHAIAFSLSASIIVALTLIPMLVSRDKFISVKNPARYKEGFIELKYPENKTIFVKIGFWIKFPFVMIIRLIVYLIVKSWLFLTELFNKLFRRFFQHVNRWMEMLITKYERLLEWALNNKKTVLLISVILVLITIAAVIDMKKEFIPESPRDEFIVEFIYPKGTSLEGNAVITSKIESVVLQTKHVENIVSNIGRVNEFDFLNKEEASLNKADLNVKIDSYENYYSVLKELRKIFDSLNGIEYSFKQVKTAYTEIISPSKTDIVIRIKNKNMNAAFAKGKDLMEKIKSAEIEGLNEVWLGSEMGIPGYDITIDREKCNAYGVDVASVANQVVNVVKGNYATFLSDFDKKIAINVRAARSKIDNIDDVKSKYIFVNNRKIPISNLIDYKLTESYSEIWHEDQTRVVYLYANVGDISVDNAIDELSKIIHTEDNTPGEIIEIGGVNDEIHSSFSQLYIALLISILLMYMILASEFESFLYPFIIIFSVPMGLIGGILLLYLFGESLSLISLIGLIILIGIADNDAVVKVEFIMRKREEGLNVHDAIIQAGHDRFRPIVMNSLTVIFGLIPMMIGFGAGTQLRISLSLAIAGGLVSATVLTLIIIPVLYTYMEKWSRKKYD